MTEKRQLTEEEQKQVSITLIDLTERNQEMESTIKYYDLMLNELLDMQFREKKREFKNKKHELEQEIQLNKKTMELYSDAQINGIEIKERKEEEDGIKQV